MSDQINSGNAIPSMGNIVGLLQEELCRVISEADRWMTVEIALAALQRARQLKAQMKQEMEYHSQAKMQAAAQNKYANGPLVS